jgi:hypothetical protein
MAFFIQHDAESYFCIMTTDWFGFNKSKVIQALRYHFISRREIRYLLIFVNLFALASAGLFYWKKVTPLAFLMASALWVMLMIIFWFIMPFLVYKRTRMFRNQFRALVDEAGLELMTEEGKNRWAWERFNAWTESPHFFHFYFSERSFFILPKEAFPVEKWEEVRSICRLRIGKRL